MIITKRVVACDLCGDTTCLPECYTVYRMQDNHGWGYNETKMDIRSFPDYVSYYELHFCPKCSGELYKRINNISSELDNLKRSISKPKFDIGQIVYRCDDFHSYQKYKILKIEINKCKDIDIDEYWSYYIEKIYDSRKWCTTQNQRHWRSQKHLYSSLNDLKQYVHDFIDKLYV